MIGQYGIPCDPMDTTAAADLTAAANGAIAMGLSAFYWAIYNTGLASFGLVGPDFAHYRPGMPYGICWAAVKMPPRW